MRLIRASGVSDAWPEALRLLDACGERQSSRAGDVLVAPWPVVTAYSRPRERVLLDEVRDANPFFHLFEAIWMLAGASDARWLDRFVRDFSSRFAEDDGTMHGAYGHRWRRHFDVDQLAVVVDRLRRDPTDRRSVIQMWDPVADLIGPDEEDVRDFDDPDAAGVRWPTEPRDVPCNQSALPRVVGGALDLTVISRSHDVVWGLYGANSVHFSVLQEYLAAAIGAEVGSLYFVSNNWHCYESTLDKLRWRAQRAGRPLIRDATEPYPGVAPMVTVPHEFLRDSERWVAAEEPTEHVYANSWFRTVAMPMWAAHRVWRDGRADEALRVLDHCAAPDWALAARRWIARRADRRAAA